MGQSWKEWRLAALKGLGQIYVRIGKISEAEESYRQGISLGKKIGLPARELVWLYFGLGEVMYWQNRGDERIRIGEEGLALLGKAKIASTTASQSSVGTAFSITM